VKLAGKVALVTGAGVRVGKEIALALADEKMRVIVHYNNSAPAAEETAQEITAQGGEALLLRADLRSKMQIDELVKAALTHWGQIDLLINNAAVYYKTPFAELTPAEWDHIMDVNLRAPFLCSLIIGQKMKAQGEGKIINIADWAADRPYSDYLPYCVSKAGLVALTKALAKALAPQVQVNAISPGAVLLAEDFPAQTRQLAIEHTLVKRLGKPMDVVAAVLFLAAGSDFITGSNIIIDGGRSIYSI
jgi:NAD(P)-dependent dehydrogenase (short-subunit alcohol dehydrogenase family)